MLSVSQAPLPWVFGFSATPLQAYSYSGISKPPNRQTLMGGFVWFPRGADLWGPASASCFSGRMENSGKSCDPCHVMSCHAMSHYVILVAKSTYSVIFSSTNKTWLARLVFPPDSDSHSSTDRLLWEIRPTVRGCRYLLCLGVNRKVPKIWKTTSICLF